MQSGEETELILVLGGFLKGLSAKFSEDGEFLHTPGLQKVNLTQINS